MAEESNATPEPLSAPVNVNAKYKVKQDLQAFILTFCDNDIRNAFEKHGFTVEPLLMQLIREVNALRQKM